MSLGSEDIHALDWCNFLPRKGHGNHDFDVSGFQPEHTGFSAGPSFCLSAISSSVPAAGQMCTQMLKFMNVTHAHSILLRGRS